MKIVHQFDPSMPKAYENAIDNDSIHVVLRTSQIQIAFAKEPQNLITGVCHQLVN